MRRSRAIRPSTVHGRNEPMEIRGLKKEEGGENGLGQDGDTAEEEEEEAAGR